MDDICSNRHQGNEMSEKAFNSLPEGVKESTKKRIFRFLFNAGSYGATVEEISNTLNIRYTTVSARCSELKRDGKIKEHGERKTTSGNLSSVLKIED